MSSLVSTLLSVRLRPVVVSTCLFLALLGVLFYPGPDAKPQGAAGRSPESAVEQPAVTAPTTASPAHLSAERATWKFTGESAGDEAGLRPALAAASRSRNELPAGRRWRLDDFPDPRALKEGERVTVTLPDGRQFAGTVAYSRRDEGRQEAHLTVVGFDNGIGSLAALHDAAERRTKGHLVLGAEKTAWTFSAADGEPVWLTEHLREDLICDFPTPTTAGAPANALRQDPLPGDPLANGNAGTPPALSSRATALGVLYLDFDGQAAAFYPNWITQLGTLLPYEVPHSGLTAEQMTIMWRRVSEDFAPFNIDVTTVASRYWNAPPGRRMRMLIAATLPAGVNAAGVAWNNSYRLDGPFVSDVPCWLSVDAYNNNGLPEAVLCSVAASVGHEFGHTLGLYHDGNDGMQPTNTQHGNYYNGHGSPPLDWSPIMGTPYRNNARECRAMVQWSTNSYPGANNSQDDMAIIAGPLNGAGWVPDESTGPGNAGAMTPVAPHRVGGAGVIANSSDADWWRFTVQYAGSGTVEMAPADESVSLPNLDCGFYIADDTGTNIAGPFAAPDNLEAAAVWNFTPGTYYVVAFGTGNRQASDGTGYSNYGSAGRYVVTGELPVDNQAPRVVISSPANNSLLTTAVIPFEGTATDNEAVTRVELLLRRDADGAYWNGTYWQIGRNGAWLSNAYNPAIHTWSCTAPLPQAGGSGADSLNAGNYTFQAWAYDGLENFAFTESVTTVDATGPGVSITSPLSGSLIGAPGLTFTGFITDNGNIAGVPLYLRRNADGYFWNGTAWQPGATGANLSSLVVPVPLTSLAQWFCTSPLPELGSTLTPGSYNFIAIGVDGIGNAQQADASVIVDGTPPFTAITEPANGTVIYDNPIVLRGTISDNGGVWRVVCFLRRHADNLYWDGSTWIADPGPANLSAAYNSGAGTWACTATLPAPGGALENGDYNFIALGFDYAGNVHQVDSVVTVDYHRIYTWTGATLRDGSPLNDSNDWGTAANWSPYGVPGAEDYVVHSNGDLIQNYANRTVRGLRLSGGYLYSYDMTSLTTTHDSTWTGGWIGGGWTNAAGASVIVSGLEPKYFYDNTVLNNYGLFEWRGGGTLISQSYAGAPVTFNNQAGGVFRIAGDGNLFIRQYGNLTAIFNNLLGGRIEKAAGEGIAYWYYWTLNNDSDIFLNSGELYPYANEVHFRSASALMGSGTFRLNTACYLHTNLFATATMPFIGGFVSCEDNAERIWSGPGVLNWSAGTLYGKLTRPAGTTTLLTGADHKDMADDCELINEGTLTWTGDGSLRGRSQAGSGATIRNRGNFTANTPGDFIISYGNVDSNFYNETGATFTKLNPNTTHSTWRWHNAGTVNVLQGWLEWHTGGTHTGNFNIAANCWLHLLAGTHSMADGTAFNGGGNVLINGATVNAAGALQNNLTGGVELRSGWLGLNAQLQGSSPWRWTGGGLFGSVSLAAGCALDISGAENLKELWDDTTFENYGTVTWQGGAQLRSRNYAGAPFTFNNHSIFRFAADGSPLTQTYGNNRSVFRNLPGARIEKSAGSGIAYWYYWALENEAEIAIPTGGLYFYLNRVNLREGSAVTGTGTLYLNTEAYLYASRIHSTAATNWLGVYLAADYGATRTWAGPGLFTWTSGTLYGSLKFETGVSSVFSGEDSKVMQDSAEIINEGSLTWTGGGSIVAVCYTGTGAVIRNRGSFIANTPADLLRVYGNLQANFYNEAGATFTKRNPGTTFSLWQFYNAGTVNIEEGGLEWRQDGTHTGSFNIAADCWLYTSSGTQSFADGTPFNGAGNMLINGGQVNAAGVLNNNLTGGIEQRNGWLGVNAHLQGSGPWRWTGGGLFGNVSLGAGCTLDVLDSPAGAAIKDFWDDTTFENYGTFTWQGGSQIRSRNYAGEPFTFNNHGVFRLAADGTPLTQTYSNNRSVFNNLTGAHLEVTAVSGVAYWYYWTLNNEAEIAIPTGGLYFYLNRLNLREGTGVTGNGTLWLNTEAWLFASRIHSTVSTNFTGNYFAADAGSTHTLAGPGLFTWSSGALYGSLKREAGTTTVLSGTDLKSMADGSELINAGDLTYSGAGNVRATCDTGTAPAIRNLPGGVFHAETTASLLRTYANLTASFENSGSVEIGDGVFYLNGWNFTQLPGGAIYSDITASGHDQIYVTTGNVTAAGNLHLRRAAGFTPPQGTSYNILTGSSRAGNFANVTGGFTADYQPTLVSVTALPPAETYAKWIAAAGFTGPDAETTADPDHDGVDNLTEFAFKGNPGLSGDLAWDRSLLELDGEQWITLHYRRWQDREQAGVVYEPGASTALSMWGLAGLIDEPDPSGVVIPNSTSWRSRIRLGGDPRFMRVSVRGTWP